MKKISFLICLVLIGSLLFCVSCKKTDKDTTTEPIEPGTPAPTETPVTEAGLTEDVVATPTEGDAKAASFRNPSKLILRAATFSNATVIGDHQETDAVGSSGDKGRTQFEYKCSNGYVQRFIVVIEYPDLFRNIQIQCSDSTERLIAPPASEEVNILPGMAAVGFKINGTGTRIKKLTISSKPLRDLEGSRPMEYKVKYMPSVELNPSEERIETVCNSGTMITGVKVVKNSKNEMVQVAGLCKRAIVSKEEPRSAKITTSWFGNPPENPQGNPSPGDCLKSCIDKDHPVATVAGFKFNSPSPPEPLKWMKIVCADLDPEQGVFSNTKREISRACGEEGGKDNDETEAFRLYGAARKIGYTNGGEGVELFDVEVGSAFLGGGKFSTGDLDEWGGNGDGVFAGITPDCGCSKRMSGRFRCIRCGF